MLRGTLSRLLSAIQKATDLQTAERILKQAERIGKSSGYRSGLRKATKIIRN